MVVSLGVGNDDDELAIVDTKFSPAALNANHQQRTHLPAHQFTRGRMNVYTETPVIPNNRIEFVIVNETDHYKVRCERRPVVERSSELARIVETGPKIGLKSDNLYQISDVDKFDFEIMIRFMETRVLRYRDHKHLLKLLDLADRYKVPELQSYCIRELDLNMNFDNVLDIFRALWFYESIALSSDDQRAITTEVVGITAKDRKVAAAAAAAGGRPYTMEDYCVALLHNALQFIDMRAEAVLLKTELEALRFEELERLVQRDTLQLRSELTLFECLANWSLAECNRRNIDANADNRRTVLGPLCGMPRYLLMSGAEFRACCERIELLHTTEISMIKTLLESKRPKHLSRQQLELLEKFRKPRAKYAKMPLHLSDRSHPSNYSRKMRRANEPNGSHNGCLKKCGMCCLHVLAFLYG